MFCAPIAFACTFFSLGFLDSFNQFGPDFRNEKVAALFQVYLKISSEFHVSQYKVYTKGDKSTTEDLEALSSSMKMISKFKSDVLNLAQGWTPPMSWPYRQQESARVWLEDLKASLGSLKPVKIEAPFVRPDIDQARKTLDASMALLGFLQSNPFR